MNMDDYKKTMGKFKNQQEQIPTVSQAGEGNQIRSYFDARRYHRFGPPENKRVGSTPKGVPVQNQNVLPGEDPFKLFMQESTKKMEREPDYEEAYLRLFQLPRYDENFYPLHDILSHPHWSGEAKARMLETCLKFSQDVDRPIQGQSLQTPLERAFELQDKELGAKAATILMHYGADLNKHNHKGLRAMHQAALHGHPELLATFAMRGAHAGLTGAGRSVGDMAMEHFERSVEKTPMRVVRQSDFEGAMETYYKSMANIKKFGLHDGKWDFSAHKARLKELIKGYPAQYADYLDTMEKTLEDIEPLSKIPNYPPAKPYTNPCNGLNDPVLDRYQHPWLSEFKVFNSLDNFAENMERKTILVKSETKVIQGFNNLDKLTDPAVIASLTSIRKTLDLDVVISKPKGLNPEGDTLFTKCIRDGKYESALTLMQMNVDMHAKDKNGDTGMHILAKTCKDRDAFFLTMKQMVGVPATPPAEGRSSLLSKDVGLADWYCPNAKGETFMDVLYAQHPEWKPDPVTGKHPPESWIPDLVQQLGVVHMDTSVPEWSVGKVLQLGGPEEFLRLGKNPDPLLLQDRTLPSLEPLTAYTTKADRDNQVLALCGAVSKLHELRKDATPEELVRIRERLGSIVEGQDAETKMRALLVFTSKMDSMTAAQMEGQTTIMQSITQTMRSGDEAEKQKVFDAFNEASLDVQSNVVHFLEAQGVLMQGNLENATEEERAQLLHSVEEFQNTATLFTKQMSKYAEKVYGSDTGMDQNVTDVEVKRTGP